MKNRFSTIILFVILFIGLSLLLYPTLSNYWNSFHQSRAIAAYVETVDDLSEEEYAKMLAEAEEYNKTLVGKNSRWKPDTAETAAYNNILDITGTGIMGYVQIEKINVNLPIYHGTDEAVLQIAVGHIEGSSFPVGGESTHSVLSGHRGLPSAKLFTDLDKLLEGDTFVIRVLNEMYTYEVDQIRIVEPDDLSDLAIQEGEDLCTLVTCTPYGINSHRLLVRGHRVENAPQTNITVSSEAIKIEPILVAPMVAAPILIALFILMMIKTGKKSKKNNDKKQKKHKKTKKHSTNDQN